MNAYQAGQKLLCGDYTSYTVSGKALFVRAGRWFKEPKVGDVVYFYSKGKERVAHVGIVVGVERLPFNRFKITTVEGNTSAGKYFSRDGGCVAEKVYIFSASEVGGTNLINGFGRPVFGDDTCTAEEMVAVARAEIGYVEKASNAHLEDKKANPGDNNYTKYGAWYNMNGVYWCAEFTSWTAYMACVAHRAKAHTGWSQSVAGWTYTDENGRQLKGEWAFISGRWYVFDNAGFLIRDTWFKSGGSWYYLAEDGGMLANQWLNINGSNYFLTKTGAMATNAYIRSAKSIAPNKGYMYYYVDYDGTWNPAKDTETPDSGAEIVD